MGTKLAQKINITNFFCFFLPFSHSLVQFCFVGITKRQTSLSDSKLLCTFAQNLIQHGNFRKFISKKDI